MVAKAQGYGPMQIAIIVLAAITGIAHLVMGIQQSDTLFILNGLGYFGLLAALYAPLDALVPFRPWLRWLLIAYTALTVALYVVIYATSDTLSPTFFGLLIKAVEIALIVLLWMEGQQANQPIRRQTGARSRSRR
jgi:peptidoglycan/LPS O-acetylase OafA/YrhL